MIKTIFFDFFGVISSEVAPFWFAERFDTEKAAQLKEEYMSPADRGDITLRELFVNLSNIGGAAPEEIHRDFIERAVLNKDLLPIMDRLRENYRVVLLSNAEPEFLHEILSRDNLYTHFDRLIISGEIKMVKPNPEIFNYALSAEGISAKEAVFIDDNPKNVRAAESIGINALRFTSNESLVESLKGLGVNLV